MPSFSLLTSQTRELLLSNTHDHSELSISMISASFDIFRKSALTLRLIDINNENNSKHENHKNSLINEKQIIEAYQKLYSNINQKTTLIHRDLQSKNIFYYQQQPYVIDYQDLCLGPWLYDLASLIYDQNAQLNPVERIRLLKIFWLHYGKQVESDWDKFMVSLRKTALIRNMHGIGRHGTIYFTRDRKDSLNRIKRGLNMLLQLQQELVDQKLNLFSVLSINDLINRINQIPL